MLSLKSPAKINLFLRILRRRTDGYHDLASLFQTISLYDTIHFSLSNRDELTCNKPDIPTNHINLINRATELFRRKTGLRFGLKAHLEKQIPHEAGLGGGSSNAATTLWALNQLLGKPAGLQDLMNWSSEIGSDITFFLSQGTAYCTGRGEILRELDPLPDQKLWIAKPAEGLSTASVFKALNLEQLEVRNPEEILAEFCSGKHHYFNDLEETALKLLPPLRNFKRRLLERGFSQVVMTGSGTAFFCLGDETMSCEDHLYKVNFVNRALDRWYSQ